jgi:hypothetical protein
VTLPIQRTAKDVLAGVTFVVLGAAFAVGALGYEVGDPVRMGPGFFPLLVGGLLAILGVAVIVKPYPDEDAGPLTAPSWRALGLILGAFIVFGLTVRGLGIVPSTFLAAAMASFASTRMTIPMAIGLSVALTVISVVVFVFALSLRLPLLGTWIPL